MTAFIAIGDTLLPADSVESVAQVLRPGRDGVKAERALVTTKDGREIMGYSASIRQIVPAARGVEVVLVTLPDGVDEPYATHFPVIAWDVRVDVHGDHTYSQPIAVDCPFGMGESTWFLHEPATGRAWSLFDASFDNLALAIAQAGEALRKEAKRVEARAAEKQPA